MSNSPSIGNPRIASTLLLVFFAGAAVGMLGMQYGLHDRLHRVVAAAPTRESNRESNHDAMLREFKTKLALSSDQADQIAVVLQDYSHYYESLQDQLDDLRSTGLSRILQILQPGQREKFEKMRTELAPQLSSEPKK